MTTLKQFTRNDSHVISYTLSRKSDHRLREHRIAYHVLHLIWISKCSNSKLCAKQNMWFLPLILMES